MSIGRIHVLARGVVIDKDFILLCKTCNFKNNFYFFPGGHIEHNESAKAALVRELKEESTYDFSIKRFLGCFEHSFVSHQEAGGFYQEYNFVFEAFSKTLTSPSLIPQPEPHIELLWVPVNDMQKLDIRPEQLKTLVPQWLQAHFSSAFGSSMVV